MERKINKLERLLLDLYPVRMRTELLKSKNAATSLFCSSFIVQ